MYIVFWAVDDTSYPAKSIEAQYRTYSIRHAILESNDELIKFTLSMAGRELVVYRTDTVVLKENFFHIKATK